MGFRKNMYRYFFRFAGIVRANRSYSYVNKQQQLVDNFILGKVLVLIYLIAYKNCYTLWYPMFLLG